MDAIWGLFLLMMQGKAGQVYNLANEKDPESIWGVAALLVSLFPERGNAIRLDISAQLHQGYSRIERVALDTYKIQALGWDCAVSLRDGLHRTVESFL